MAADSTVFVVDDDDAVRASILDLMESVGHQAKGYASAPEFLEAYDPSQPGCLVLDVRMPGMSGLALQRELASLRIEIPIVFLTSHGDIEMAVDALHRGAVDFVRKPWREQALLESIGKALSSDVALRRRREDLGGIRARLDRLTAREREVLDLVLEGKTSKAIATELNISRKTVDQHRANIMAKMEAESIVELVRDMTRIRGR